LLIHVDVLKTNFYQIKNNITEDAQDNTTNMIKDPFLRYIAKTFLQLFDVCKSLNRLSQAYTVYYNAKYVVTGGLCQYNAKYVASINADTFYGI
jgi:hypothetical protein